MWLPQILQAMGFSNTATGFVVALCFLAGIPAMILVGRSSSRRGERIWHVAIPWLLAGASLAAASLVQSNAIILAALAIGLAAQFAPFGAFFSLPSSFLRGTGGGRRYRPHQHLWQLRRSFGSGPHRCADARKWRLRFQLCGDRPRVCDVLPHCHRRRPCDGTASCVGSGTGGRCRMNDRLEWVRDPHFGPKR